MEQLEYPPSQPTNKLGRVRSAFKRASLGAKTLIVASGVVLALSGVALAVSGSSDPTPVVAVAPGQETHQTIVERQPINIIAEGTTDSSLRQGETKLVRQGTPGEKELKYDVVSVDGVEVRRALISETVTRAPINSIVANGSMQCLIKGNTSFDTGEKIYHMPGDPYYGATVIEPEKGERMFCTEAEAAAAGWRKQRATYYEDEYEEPDPEEFEDLDPGYEDYDY